MTIETHNQEPERHDLPRVSIIMPIWNEGAFIDRSLGSVLAQDYPADRIEVLLADGMSSDGTRTRIEAYQRRHPNLRLIDNPGRIVSTGLNSALLAANGEVIVRVDGHTEIAPDYVSQCVAELQRSGAENVGGRMNAHGSTPFGEAVALATSSPFGVGGARFHYSEREEWVDTVYMGAWPRRLFEQIGLFDEELVRNQDDEFNYRLLKNGGRIWLSPRIRSLYTVRSQPGKLVSQYFQYGLWKVRVLQKHPRQMRVRQFVPPLFVSLFCLTLLISLAAPGLRMLFPLVAGLYLAADLLAALVTSALKGWAGLPLLPLVFPLLHFSYGVGFLAGLVKFGARWGDRQGRVPRLKRAGT